MEQADFEKIKRDIQAYLNNASDVVTEVSDNAFQELSGVLDRLDEVLNDAGSIIDSVDAELVGFESLVGECHAAIESQFDFIDGELSNVSEGLDSASETVDESLESMQSLVENISEQIDQFRDGLLDELKQLVDTSLETVEEKVIQPLTAIREECLGKIEDLLDELVEDLIPSKVAAVTDEWIKELREQLSAMIAVLAGQMDEFRTSILEGSDVTEAQREEAKVILDQLEQVLAPVMDSLGRISGLANSVGISI